MISLRVLSYDVDGLRGDRVAMDAMVRELGPDVVLVHGAPRRVRWRTRAADLADRWGLIYGGGGAPSLGSLVLVALRVNVHDVRYPRFPLVPGELARGGLLVRCEVAGRPVGLVAAQLAVPADERGRQADILAAALSDVDEPVIGSVDGGAGERAITDGRIVAGSAGRATIIVDRGIEIDRCEVVDTPQSRQASIHLPMVADLRLR